VEDQSEEGGERGGGTGRERATERVLPITEEKAFRGFVYLEKNSTVEGVILISRRRRRLNSGQESGRQNTF